MNTWRHNLPSRRATISLLVVGVFFLTIFQAHLHIHSADAHHSHAHVSDAHLLNNMADQDHHDTAKVIDAQPAGIFKKQLEDDILPILAVILFSLLFGVVRRQIRCTIPTNSSNLYRSRYRFFTPHLRAPPQY